MSPLCPLHAYLLPFSLFSVFQVACNGLPHADVQLLSETWRKAEHAERGQTEEEGQARKLGEPRYMLSA